MAKKKYSKLKTLKQFDRYTLPERTYRNTEDDWKIQYENLPDEDKYIMLFLYTAKDNKKMVKFFLERMEFDENFNHDGENLVACAGRYHSYDVLRFLVKKGYNLNVLDKDGETPLQRCVEGENFACMRFLLENGADIDSENKYQENIVYTAVYQNNAQLINFLYQIGANIECRNREGKSPLMAASQNKIRLDAAKELLKLGTDINARDYEGKNALFHAINARNKVGCDMLLATDEIDLNSQTYLGVTCLMNASKLGEKATARMLLAKGANPLVKDSYGRTAKDYAEEYGNTTCFEIAQKAEKLYRNGQTDLTFFAKQNHHQNSCVK